MTEKKYEVIDNRLIDTGCMNDHYAVALYVFSLMNKNRINKVTATLDIISDTFYNGYGKRSRRYDEFKDALARLEEFKVNDDEKNPFDFYIKALQPEDISEVTSEHEVFTYRVENYKITNGFTIFYYDEYEYLLHFIRTFNEALSSKSEKIDCVKALVLYLYLKRWISVSQAYKNSTFSSFESLGTKVGMSKNTAKKYCELLESCKMIKLIKGSWIKNEATVYDLDESWTVETENVENLTVAEEFKGEKVYAASYVPKEDEGFYNTGFIYAQKAAIGINKAGTDLTNNTVDSLLEKHDRTVGFVKEMSKCLSIRNLPQSDIYVLTKSKAVAEDYIMKTEAELVRRNTSVAEPTTSEMI